MPILIAILKEQWKAALIGSLIGGLFAALLITRGTLADVKVERDLANTKLAISNASLDEVGAELARVTAEQRKLSKGDASRVQASRETLKVVAAASQWREAATERLLASAGAIRPDPPAGCTVSDTVADIWK